MSVTAIVRKLRTLSRAGVRRQALVVEAVGSMLVARLILQTRPFHRVSRRLGVFAPPHDPRLAQRPAATPAEARRARDVGWAIAAVAPFMPIRARCLHQAMAGHAMLARRGMRGVVHLGAGKGDDTPIDAHAWLEIGGVKVTGYPIAANLAELGCFL